MQGCSRSKLRLIKKRGPESIEYASVCTSGQTSSFRQSSMSYLKNRETIFRCGTHGGLVLDGEIILVIIRARKNNWRETMQAPCK
jgi:hypothetical protein